MSKSKEYKAIKNFLHNELGVSKEVIVNIIKDELREVLERMICNTYGKSDIYSVAKDILRSEILYGGHDVYKHIDDQLNAMVSEIIKTEFEVFVVRKQFNPDKK